MPVIYLRHPKHGAKVAISEMEAENDIANGWEEFDPNVAVSEFIGAALESAPAETFAADDTPTEIVNELPRRRSRRNVGQ